MTSKESKHSRKHITRKRRMVELAIVVVLLVLAFTLHGEHITVALLTARIADLGADRLVEKVVETDSE